MIRRKYGRLVALGFCMAFGVRANRASSNQNQRRQGRGAARLSGDIYPLRGRDLVHVVAAGPIL